MLTIAELDDATIETAGALIAAGQTAGRQESGAARAESDT
jgi:hypothetical protein